MCYHGIGLCPLIQGQKTSRHARSGSIVNVMLLRSIVLYVIGLLRIISHIGWLRSRQALTRSRYKEAAIHHCRLTENVTI